MGGPAPRSSRRPAAVAGVVVLAAGAALISAALAPSSPAPAPSTRSAVIPRGLPAPVTPAFTPGPPRRLGSTKHLSHWARVRRRVSARAEPTAGAAVVARLATTTPEGTDNAVTVLTRRRDARGAVWVRVRLPVLPNGTTGWVPRRALAGYETVDTHLVVDLATLAATLYRAGRPVLRAPVGVGQAGWATPRGEFLVRNKLTRYAAPAYGPVAFGTTARSATATDWPAGGFVGIHGTDRPDLLPGRVSHGCIRLRNADILALARRMPVGTPLTVR